MKKLINDPRAVVDESVEGFGLAHADLVTVFADPKYIVRKDAPVAGKVGLVSGGGSGHEPLHGGYVGLGMLDAAVPESTAGQGALQRDRLVVTGEVHQLGLRVA